MASNPTRRVLVAVTEASPVEQLWQAAIDVAGAADAELTVLIVRDDRWERAASLPFTREISRVSGVRRDFTLERAESLAEEATTRLKSLARSLASQANVRCSYRVLAAASRGELERLVIGTGTTVVASSAIAGLPLYEEVRRLDCEVVFIDRGEDDGGTPVGR